MPKINIYEADKTGSTYLGDEIVVFLPGKCSIVKTADKNGCVLIPERSNIAEYLTDAGQDGTYEYAEMLTDRAFQVLYCPVSSVDKALFEQTWLKDKNEYNIKYLTTGCSGSVIVTSSNSKSTKASGEEQSLSFATDIAVQMMSLASERKDCVALIDVGPNSPDMKPTDLQKALTDIVIPSDDGLKKTYGASFADWGYIDDKHETSMPGSYFYLGALGTAVNNGQKWDSVAGVKRGVLSSYAAPVSMNLTKYELDNVIMPPSETETGSSSFNGIVNVRPYGYTIWGDRTLRNNKGDGLKATSFLSIRVLVCDLCKRVYNAAINNTFESNSDVTWMNYKTTIADLLDQMVADYKLADYKIIKLASDRASQIKCQIRLVPLEPVEDFDIYIQLENATANITEG